MASETKPGTPPDHASGNGKLFAEVHGLLPQLREIHSTHAAATISAHVAALDEQLVADAPDPAVIILHLAAIEQSLMEKQNAAAIAQKVRALRQQFEAP